MRKEIMEVYRLIWENANIKNHKVFRSNIVKLTSLLDINDLNFFEKGLIYWHLQDHYALLRDSSNELIIFKEFSSFVQDIDERYLFWTVCDMTQALTMRLGGYSKEWDYIYNQCKSIEVLDEEFARMKFEMFRAYIGIFTDARVLIDNKQVDDALAGILEIIIKFPNHPDNLFFRMIYYSSVIKYYNYLGKDLNAFVDELKELTPILDKYLTYEMIDLYHDECMFGSWKNISISKGKHYSAKVGLTNVLFALIESKEIEAIQFLLENVKNYNLENKRLIQLIKDKNTQIINR